MKELHLADNLDLLKRWHAEGKREFLDLIYIDPPFNSKRNYNIVFDSKTNTSEEAFSDTWTGVVYTQELQEVCKLSPKLHSFITSLNSSGIKQSNISYLSTMCTRLWYMREALKDTGSLYFHCDPTMSHYVKILMDHIFGENNFINEIIWSYGLGGSSKRAFSQKHDVILFYSKSKDYYFEKPQVPATSARMKGMMKGMPDVWDIPSLNNMSKERIGYPTQKPEELIKIIVESSCPPDGVTADFFMGGGTTLASAQMLGRNFIGSDINYRAIQITKDRLEKLGLVLKDDFFVYGIPRDSAELRKMVEENILGESKNSRFAFEDVIVKYYLKDVVGNDKKVGDDSIDGRFIFKHNENTHTGVVQVTTGKNIMHFNSFCSKIGKGIGTIGVYIAFENRITKAMVKEANSYGHFGGVDKVQILTIEDLIDNKKYFSIPAEQHTIV